MGVLDPHELLDRVGGFAEYRDTLLHCLTSPGLGQRVALEHAAGAAPKSQLPHMFTFSLRGYNFSYQQVVYIPTLLVDSSAEHNIKVISLNDRLHCQFNMLNQLRSSRQD